MYLLRLVVIFKTHASQACYFQVVVAHFNSSRFIFVNHQFGYTVDLFTDFRFSAFVLDGVNADADNYITSFAQWLDRKVIYNAAVNVGYAIDNLLFIHDWYCRRCSYNRHNFALRKNFKLSALYVGNAQEQWFF